MNYITTTQLRTETPDLIATLIAGRSVDLIHRSEVIGEIKPKRTSKPKYFDAQKAQEVIEKMALPKLTQRERDKNYSDAMVQKHGKRIH